MRYINTNSIRMLFIKHASKRRKEYRLTEVDLAYLLDDVPQDPRVVQSHENI